MNIELIFILANICFLIGTSLLIRRIIKNRNSLRDFDPYGSSTNFIGMMINGFALAGLGMYSSLIISFPTIAFWALAALYSLKNK